MPRIPSAGQWMEATSCPAELHGVPQRRSLLEIGLTLHGLSLRGQEVLYLSRSGLGRGAARGEEDPY